MTKDSNFIVRKCVRRDLEELVQFAYKINGTIEHASTFCSNTLDAIHRDFEDSISSDSSVECRKGDQLIGILTCYVDHEKGNADCSLLIEPKVCYENIAIRLFDEIRKQFSPSMKYTFFFPKENTDCSNFLKNIGAHREVNEYSLLLKRGNINFLSHSFTIIDLPQEYNKHFVYTMIDNEQIIAYSVLKLKNEKRATAEIVAVRDGFRYKGYGRAILSYLVNKAFENYGMEYVDLIVDGDNENAIRLYLDLGFDVESENCCYIVNNTTSLNYIIANP